MLKPDEYIRRAKKTLGNESMSDREFGERLGGFAPSTISNARYGTMSDPLAIKVAATIGADPGEVLMVARVAREKDSEVKAALSAWASKTLASMSKNAALPDTVEAGDIGAMCIM